MTPPTIVPNASVGEPAFERTLEAHAAAAIIAGNRVDLLVNGAEIFPATLEAIRSARNTITYAQYYWGEGQVGRVLAEAFAERCERGVPVTVLLDAFGALGMPDAHRRILEAAGCRVEVFRPLATTPPRAANHRQHSRILVVDGRIGFTGGSGVSRDWIGSADGVWRETDVRVEGPAVAALQAAFVRRWSEATGERLGGAGYFPALEAAGTVPVQVVDGRPWHGQRSIQDLFLLCFAGARQSLLVSNPYFLPDAALRRALIEAAGRGVRVALLLPGKIDYRIVRRASRAEFGPLLRAGIEIYEYQAARLHAKTAVVDGRIAIVGSANLDPRSLTLNAELDVVAHSPDVAGRLARTFADDVAHARRVDPATWSQRPWSQRFLELLLRPVRSLL